MEKERRFWIKTLKKFSSLLGIFIFIYIIFRIDLKRLYQIIETSDFLYIIVSVILFPIILFIMALRWHFVLRSIGIHNRFIYTFDSLVKGSVLGEITPARIGELIRAKYITAKTNYSLGKAIFSVVFDRIYDIWIIIVLSGMSFLFVLKTYEINLPIYLISGCLLGIFVLFAIFLNKNVMRSLLSFPLKSFILKKYEEKSLFHINEFYDGLTFISARLHTACAILTTIIWVLKFVVLYFLAQALRIYVPFWFVMSFGSISVIISLLPISISGIGTRDAVYIYFLSLYGLTAEFAVALSFLYLVYGIFGIGIFGGYAYAHEFISFAGKTTKSKM